ncbi:MAG TPA: HD domain-containing protein [Lentimicrobium sp.]|nr:HD domain-containing protein [Lentimicrobium sp.]
MNDNTDISDQRQIIETTAGYVKNELYEAEGGHDWYHIRRVWKNAVFIAKKEKRGNLFVIELAALLHDIADAKFHNGDETIGPRLAEKFLRSLQVPEAIIHHVIRIIENISFRKRHHHKTDNSIELQIVQDADRLDAIGAIGIARVFNFGGFMNRPLYDPLNETVKRSESNDDSGFDEQGLNESGKDEIELSKLLNQTLKDNQSPAKSNYPVNGNGNSKDSKDNRKHTIGHFYDKLLLLSGMMNTQTAKAMAAERHEFMVRFLEQFYKEWEVPE